MTPPNNQSQEVLRECPCCNSTVTVGGGVLSQERYSIRCSCGITLKHSDKLVLIEKWNIRATSQLLLKGGDDKQVNPFHTAPVFDQSGSQSCPERQSVPSRGEQEPLPEDLQKAIEKLKIISKVYHFTTDFDLVLDAATKSASLQKQLEEAKHDRNKAALQERQKWIQHIAKLETRLKEVEGAAEKMYVALNIAIGTVECASIDLNTQRDLPWYRNAKYSIELAKSAGIGGGK